MVVASPSMRLDARPSARGWIHLGAFALTPVLAASQAATASFVTTISSSTTRYARLTPASRALRTTGGALDSPARAG